MLVFIIRTGESRWCCGVREEGGCHGSCFLYGKGGLDPRLLHSPLPSRPPPPAASPYAAVSSRILKCQFADHWLGSLPGSLHSPSPKFLMETLLGSPWANGTGTWYLRFREGVSKAPLPPSLSESAVPIHTLLLRATGCTHREHQPFSKIPTTRHGA